MLFNSLEFVIFLPLVFIIYWGAYDRSLRLQNTILFIASYTFYGWWDWRFLFLLAFSSIVDFITGHLIYTTQNSSRRKIFLSISVIVNLGLLGFFKYYGFFIESFQELLTNLGFYADISTLRIVLPVGISFYTFQTMSYTLDIYRGRLVPTKDIIAFFTFVSFFPQLVAGPIERAENLLPQFLSKRHFDLELAKDGMRQILWGLIKKMVIADKLAPYVDGVYGQYNSYNGPVLLLGTLYFAIQIYCDFSGYSDIAIGTARLFGFELMRNFAFPYFSRDIGEFWRRWHISLSTWFRDYLYIPLGGSRTNSKARHIINLILTFTISGLWHGANWTFIFWGFLNGVLYIPLVLSQRHKLHTDIPAKGRILPTIKEAMQIGITFLSTLFAWIFFRADSLGHAFGYIGQMLHSNWLINPTFKGGLPYVVFLLLAEWLQRDKMHVLQISDIPIWGRWAIYYAGISILFFYANTGHVPFIYFQF